MCLCARTRGKQNDRDRALLTRNRTYGNFCERKYMWRSTLCTYLQLYALYMWSRRCVHVHVQRVCVNEQGEYLRRLCFAPGIRLYYCSTLQKIADSSFSPAKMLKVFQSKVDLRHVVTLLQNSSGTANSVQSAASICSTSYVFLVAVIVNTNTRVSQRENVIFINNGNQQQQWQQSNLFVRHLHAHSDAVIRFYCLCELQNTHDADV